MLLVILLLTVIGLGYLLNKYLFNYWSKLGFKQLEPKFFYGDAAPIIKIQTSMGEFFADLYNKHKNIKILGTYMSYRPILIVNDAKLVQDIMIRDFTYFHDRPVASNEEKDPLSGNLFNLPGQPWRDLRVKLSPTFTSGKLKGMFSVIKDCGQTLDDYMAKNLKNGVDVFEFRDLMARFNTNIISSVAFGLENDCINEPDHIFRKMGAKIFAPTFSNAIRGLISFLTPSLFHKFNLKMVEKDVEDFIFSMVHQTVDHREKNNVARNDFMQLLIQLKNQGFVSVDKGEKESEEEKSGNMNKLNINQLAAQVFVFFIAGFETSSSTMSFCLYELARNKEVQRKAQEEIDSVLKKAGPGGISYDVLNDLKYLECCIDETLRKYPIVPMHFRTAARDYKVADSNLVIPQGSAVFIPVLGFQRDPDIYDEPMAFKPERFLDSPNGGGKIKGVFYTPFGDGPRNCIGMRLGKLTTKIGLAIIMSKYNLELTDKKLNHGELEFHPNQFVLTPKELINIKITSR